MTLKQQPNSPDERFIQILDRKKGKPRATNKVESVELALKLLDESVVRGRKIRVQRARFQMRGEYNPTLKPKRSKKDKAKMLKMKEKLFDWRPEKMRGERSKHEKIVIIKNLFTPDLFDKEVHLIIDYQNDLREECSKCGTVRKVVIYDRHSEGVAQINMADPDEADLVVQMMNGRFFGKRKLVAEIWDGKTKYKIAETEKEVKERINKWDKYLSTDEDVIAKDKESVDNASSA